MPPHEPLSPPAARPLAEPLRRAPPGTTPQDLRRALELPSRERVLALYEAGRFLDAHALTREAWRYDAVSLGLDVDELVLAARLAVRLGSPRRHALLMRLAHQRAPGSPEIELHRQRSFRHGSSFLEARRMLDGVPDGPPMLRSDWRGSLSMHLGSLRDFELAQDQLASARAGEHDPAWLDACAAMVALQRDATSEADALALAAWERAPGRPSTARALMAVRAKQGRALEAAELLLRCMEGGGQSFEVLMIAVVALLTAAQATTGEAAATTARRALAAAEPLERLAPLADTKLLQTFAFMRAEAARLLGDHELVARHAQHAASPFYADVAARLARGDGGARTILPHHRVAQRHDTCLPASVATCAGVLGLDVDQDALAGEVTWGGTALWRVLEHAARRGWQTRVFTVEKDIATALLERGLPFVVSLFGPEIGHACAAVGFDLAMGTLILHDPAGPSTRELLLDKLHVGQAPLGPLGLLLAPPGLDLEELTWPEQDVQRIRLEIERRVEHQGAREAAELARSLPAEGELATYVRTLMGLLEGRPHAVLDELQALARRHPETSALQTMVVRCVEEIGNPALMVEQLEAQVLHRHRAGVESRQAWFEVPAGVVARYAALLQGTAEVSRAEHMLHEALWREGSSSACMGVLADLTWSTHRFDEALWAYRWASTLAPDSEPAARAYAWALKKRGQRARGLAWLRARAEHARSLAASRAEPWVSWVQMLEEFGEPARALEEAERAVAEPDPSRGDQAFAARLLARYGRHEPAARALAAAWSHAPRATYYATACALARSAGDLPRALELAGEWERDDPRNTGAFAIRLQLVRGLEGTAAALALAREQVEARPGHAVFEDILLDELERNGHEAERERILQARIDANPYEVWALRELGHDLVVRAQRTSGRVRAELVARAEALCERCRAHDPHHPVTSALHGDLAVLRGDLEGGARGFGHALTRAPDYGYALQRLGEVMARTPAADRHALVEYLDRAAEAARHDLDMAGDGARLIAQLMGLREAERALERWSASSPDDPRLLEARADVQLEYGLGATAAERVRPELEAAVERYPLHAGLRLLLARAYRMLDRRVDAMATYGRLAHDFPDDLSVQHELSQLFIEAGEPETAVELLEEVARRAPGHAAAWLALAAALIEVGDVPRAIEQLRVAHERMPSDPELLERLTELLRARGAAAEAIQLASHAAARAPDSARLLYVHASVLAECGADPTDVDAAFRRAIASDVHRWEPVHDWSLQLAAAGRHDDALALLEEHLQHTTNPAAVEGQRAVIFRKAGAPVRALEVLVAALEGHPDYAWGWVTFMQWAREDEQPGLVRDMLPRLSPALAHAAGVQAQALLTWQWAGAEPEWLEAQWSRLVADHGREPVVALVRADLLLEAGRHAEVLPLLDRLPKGPRSEPRVLARAIRAHVAAGARELALADVRASWRAPGTSDGLPRSTVLALREAHWLEPAAQAMVKDLEAGERVTHGAIVSIAMVLAQVPANVPEVVDRLVALLGERDDSTSRRVLSFVFDALCDAGRATRVLAWKRKHGAVARKDPDLWLAIGRAYLLVGRHEKLVQWFEGWRERDGLEMWGVSNYLEALWSRREWERCLDETRWALEHVAPDPSLPRVARRLVEASLMVGSCTPAQDFSDFVADHERYAALLEVDAANVEPWERQLYADLRALVATTEPSQMRAPAARLRDLCRQLVLDQDWRIGVARHYLRRYLGWWQRLWIRV